MSKVSVVGVVGGEVFGRVAQAAIDAADVVVGSRRQLAWFPARDGQEHVELAGPLLPLVEHIAATSAGGKRVCVLASGDPGFFGIVRLLSARLEGIAVHPAPSAVSLTFAAVGTVWDDAVVVSAHGREPGPAVEAALHGAKVAILTAPESPPESIGARLAAAGCGTRRIVVASRLGEADESIVETDLAGLAGGRFDPMSVVVVMAPPGREEGPALSWGADERRFAHRDGMITKAEVRAIVLAKLELPSAGVLWDVGAGSGSIGVEAASLAPGLRVCAVERSADDAANVVRNADALGVAVDVVVGEAPDVLDGLPEPDRVIVGGGGPDVLGACWELLRPGGRLVATFAVLEHAMVAHALLGEMIQVRVDRAVPIGSAGTRLDPLNPVFVCWGDKP